MQLIHILHFFMIKFRGVIFWEWGFQGIGPHLPILWSGNSLSRKAQTWWEKWGVLHLIGKLPTGMWCRAVFFIIARKMSPLTIVFRNKRVSNFFMKVHHTLTFENHTHIQECHEDFQFIIHNSCSCWCKSHPLMLHACT
jgi:hypothetical protein